MTTPLLASVTSCSGRFFGSLVLFLFGMGDLEEGWGGEVFGEADVYGCLACGVERDDGGRGGVDIADCEEVVEVGEEIEEGGV